MISLASLIWPLLLFLGAIAFCISWWNFSRYIEAKSDKGEANRYLQMAIYARNDGNLTDKEVNRIAASYYSHYQKRFWVSLTTGVICLVLALIVYI